MLLVALPIRNTENSDRCTGLLRAPTTRSVPEIVAAKLSRDSLRSRSTPSNSITASAIDSSVSTAVNLRLRRLLTASARIIVETSGQRQHGPGRSVDVGELHRAIEQRGERRIVTDEDQSGPLARAFAEQQAEQGRAPVRAERRGWFIGCHQLQRPDQRPGRRDP